MLPHVVFIMCGQLVDYSDEVKLFHTANILTNYIISHPLVPPLLLCLSYPLVTDFHQVSHHFYPSIPSFSTLSTHSPFRRKASNIARTLQKYLIYFHNSTISVTLHIMCPVITRSNTLPRYSYHRCISFAPFRHFHPFSVRPSS